MILFINTYITEEKFSTQGAYVRQKAKFSNKIDVFKYMLSSLADFYPWHKVIINVDMDKVYENEKENLSLYIKNLFDKYPLLLRFKRNSLKSEWIEDYDLFDDDLIMYIGNHDHIFIDPEPTYFANIIDKYRNVDDYIGIQFSHWQELSVNLWREIIETTETTLLEDHFYFKQKLSHAIQVINKKTYKMWWFDKNLPDIQFPRSDGVGTPSLCSFEHFKPLKIIVPYREICRHFDGYQHTIWNHLPNETVPVIEIPNDFFNKSLKINYSTKYLNNYLNINPIDDRLKIFDDAGFDLNLPIKVWPKFWQNHIIEIKNDFDKMKVIWSDQDIKNLYINRIVNVWNYSPGYQSKIGQLFKQKVIEYHNKLF